MFSLSIRLLIGLPLMVVLLHCGLGLLAALAPMPSPTRWIARAIYGGGAILCFIILAELFGPGKGTGKKR